MLPPDTARVAVAACVICRRDQSGQLTQFFVSAHGVQQTCDERFHLTLDPRILHTCWALVQVLLNAADHDERHRNIGPRFEEIRTPGIVH